MKFNDGNTPSRRVSSSPACLRASLRVWLPGPLIEKDARTGTWQMLAPHPETSCDVFGTNDLVGLSGRVDEIRPRTAFGSRRNGDLHSQVLERTLVPGHMGGPEPDSIHVSGSRDLVYQ
ncbi:TraU family protein [Nitrosococcus oceani]|uniref:TraU family protein n=1 Tax=Nitrosococcus oceani TaxID=1229 RepID=UPI001E4999B4|nr:TraU family protein [Nitrosococcus oceani]